MEKENQKSPSDFPELRKHAEKKLQQDTEEQSTFSEEGKDYLIQELRVHQIELEMQNDELCKTQVELQESRDEYIDLYDFAPVGYLTLSKKGIILKANITVSTMLGTERTLLINKPFSQFVFHDNQDDYYFFINRLLSGENNQELELKLKKGEGSLLHAHLQADSIKKGDDNHQQFRVTVTNITKRKQAEEQIKASLKEKETLLYKIEQSENRFKGVVELLPGAIIEMDTDFMVTYVNQAGLELFGYTGQDIQKGMMGLDLLHPDDREKAAQRIIEYYEEERVSAIEYRVLGKDKKEIPVLFKSVPIIQVGKITGFRAVMTDIRRLKHAEKSLRDNEALLSAFTKAIPNIALILDEDGTYIKVFATQNDLLITKPVLLEGNNIHNVLPNEVANDVLKVIHKTIKTNQSQNIEYKLELPTGENWFRARTSKMKIDIDGKKTIVWIANDITKRKIAEEQLKESNLRYQTVADFNYDWETWTDPDDNYVYVSPSCERISGYKTEEFIDDPDLMIKITDPIDKEVVTKHFVKHEKLLSQIHPIDFRITKKNGETVWISHACQRVFDADGNDLGRRGSNREITDRKVAEEQIKSSLLEKETLLHEIHHRVKNNLTVVGSLLSLQASSINDERLTAALMDSKNRVRSMSAIHETLYQSDNLSAIDMNTYLLKLTRDVAQNYAINTKVNLIIEAEHIMIGAKQASPLGLIINEMITNSFKYAFPDNQVGEIDIRMQKLDDQAVLIYKDNGVGMPEDFDWKNTKSMGLKLVKMLSENQLDGSLEMESNNGTKFIIKFDIEK